MAKWRRLRVWTIADTEVLKTIVDREFLKTRENILDLWIREDNAFIKIRGYRGLDPEEAFKNRKVFQKIVPTKQFKDRIRNYVENTLLKSIPDGEPSKPEQDWYGSVLEVEKIGKGLHMIRHGFFALTDEDLRTLREWLEKYIAEIDEILEKRKEREGDG